MAWARSSHEGADGRTMGCPSLAVHRTVCAALIAPAYYALLMQLIYGLRVDDLLKNRRDYFTCLQAQQERSGGAVDIGASVEHRIGNNATDTNRRFATLSLKNKLFPVRFRVPVEDLMVWLSDAPHAKASSISLKDHNKAVVVAAAKADVEPHPDEPRQNFTSNSFRRNYIQRVGEIFKTPSGEPHVKAIMALYTFHKTEKYVVSTYLKAPTDATFTISAWS